MAPVRMQFPEADELKEAESFTAEIETFRGILIICVTFIHLQTSILGVLVHDRHYANGITIITLRVYCALTGYQALYQTLYEC